MPNHLVNAISPYLLQHQHNPVEWYPWGETALALAVAHDCPILLSIGYAACHWCHVMAHESFTDPDIAAFLKQHFIAIKVDREERPDLDKIYMDALMLLHGHGGWPLTLFLTPEGKPFFGGTYFPKRSTSHQLGFMELLQRIATAWQSERATIMQISTQLTNALKETLPVTAPQAVSYRVTIQYASSWYDSLDHQQGGMRGAPKFPQVAFWRYLFAASVSLKDRKLLTLTQLTAHKLCLGGIYDHVGGGWMRYSTDERWLVPHFEKMLYDNAQIIVWFTELYAYQANPLLKKRITDTIAWLSRELLTSSGAFAASLDADSDGGEGNYYVWEAQQIAQLLGARADAFKAAYDVTDIGNWEQRNILHQNHSQAVIDQEFTAELALLLQARQQRMAPARDDKILADWNGLVISALATASQVFNCPAWLSLAQATFASISQHLYHKPQLFHCYRAGHYCHFALLEDYANMIAAALALYGASGAPCYLTDAICWTQEVHQNYWSDDVNAYQQCSKLAPPLLINPINAHDNAVPSGNGIMAENLAKLWFLTSEPHYLTTVTSLLATFHKPLSQKNAAFYSHLSLAQGLLEQGLWIKVARDNPLKLSLYQGLPPLSQVVEMAEFGDGVVICQQQQCLPPLLTTAEIANFLKTFAVTR